MFQAPYQTIVFQWKVNLSLINQQEKRIRSLIQIRKLLSLPQQTHAFQRIINMELHQSVMNCATRIVSQMILSKDDQQQLYNIIWIFVNLCCFGNQKTAIMINIGIISFTHKCFQFNQYPQIMRNITGETNNTYKVQYLHCKDFYHFFKDTLFIYWKYNRIAENATWALMNCFRDLKMDNFPLSLRSYIINEVVIQYIPLLYSLLSVSGTSEEASTYLLSSLLYITDNLEKFIGYQIENIILPGLMNQNFKIRILVAKILGSIVANTSEGVTMVLNHPDIANYLFESINKSIFLQQRSNSAWIISNVMAGSQKQIQQLISDSIFLEKMKESIYVNIQNKNVLKELIWSICNLISSSSKEQFHVIYQSNIISNIASVINKITDLGCLETYLEALSQFLTKTKQSSHLNWEIIDNCKAKIEQSLEYAVQINFKFFDQSQKIQSALYEITNYEELMMNMKI